MTRDNQRFRLKSKDGKYLTVRRFSKELRLVAVEAQNGTEIGCVRIITENKGMAFYFEREQEYCLAMVEGGKLKLEIKSKISENLPLKYWFKKKDIQSSEHYCLRTAVQPILYLCHSESSFCLTSKNECVPVTAEKANV